MSSAAIAEPIIKPVMAVVTMSFFSIVISLNLFEKIEIPSLRITPGRCDVPVKLGRNLLDVAANDCRVACESFAAESRIYDSIVRDSNELARSSSMGRARFHAP